MPATPHRLQNPKRPSGGPKMADGVWKGVYPKVFGCSGQLLLNKFFDPSSRSMRKGRNGGEMNVGKTGEKRKKRKEKRMAFLVATTSLPAVYRPNGYARTTTAGTLHARANSTGTQTFISSQKRQINSRVWFKFKKRSHNWDPGTSKMIVPTQIDGEMNTQTLVLKKKLNV